MERIHRYDRVDSTNLEARRLWPGPPPQGPLAVVAAGQTAGRGRLDRSWASPKGGLWLTLAWPIARPARHYRAAALVAGLAVVEAVKGSTGLEPELKWPNDLLLAEAKTGGILSEMHAAASPPLLLVGVGLNADFAAADLPADLRYPATTLRDVLGGPVDLEALLTAVLDSLAWHLAGFEKEGLAPYLPLLKARLAWVGRQVQGVAPGGGVVQGELRGLDEDGAALIHTGGEVVAFQAGDLSMRPGVS